MRNRFAAAAVALLVSVAVLVMLVLLIAGPAYFGSLLSEAVWHVLGISIAAAIIRLPFRRGGLILSAICGALIAIAGFLIVLAHAVSKV
jgi:hypothetical protein